MIRLSYASTAARPMTAAQLLAILQQCYNHNSLNNVTGLLLYGNGTFLQALEGEDDVVGGLYDRIARDERHSAVTCLSRETIEERRYPGWTMEFRRMPDIGWKSADGSRRLGKHEFTPDFLADQPGARDALLTDFRPAEIPGPEADPRDRHIAQLQKSLRRAQGGVEIARLALEDIAEAHVTGRFGDSQGKLCRFALGQINGI